MLEYPKVSCTNVLHVIQWNTRNNQEDVTMGNQQERFELELSWLAGIIEGEGWISLLLYKNNQKKGNSTPAFTPCIGMCNTDMIIVEKVKSMFQKLGIKYRYQKRYKGIGSDGVSRKELAEISVVSKCNIRILGNAILPYMIGEKKNRVELVMKFLDLRDSKPSSGPYSSYGNEEFAIYETLYSYKGKSRSKILNDYTPESTLVM